VSAQQLDGLDAPVKQSRRIVAGRSGTLSTMPASTTLDQLRSRRDTLVWGGYAIIAIVDALRLFAGIDAGAGDTILWAITIACWIAIAAGAVEAVRVWQQTGPLIRWQDGRDALPLLFGLAGTLVLVVLVVVALAQA
jgi:hypothetical protein